MQIQFEVTAVFRLGQLGTRGSNHVLVERQEGKTQKLTGFFHFNCSLSDQSDKRQKFIVFTGHLLVVIPPSCCNTANLVINNSGAVMWLFLHIPQKCAF